MAINIFSCGSGNQSKNSKVNSASASDRAKAAKDALTGPAEASDSGSTAVGSSGVLGKVGSVVGKIAGIGSKFLPGIWGGLARGLANQLNDPEWWQQVPGDAITLNEPLRALAHNGERFYHDGAYYRGFSLRTPILEVITSHFDPDNGLKYAIAPTMQAITQYLMPQVRKVVNAVPLQDAEHYRTALQSAATIYAVWRNLKKFDYLLKHGQTYLPNLNDPAFPLLQNVNAAWLQSTINRLEEYLRSNIRLPHTMCEYLAWRFGRIYKSNDSAKSALVMYNILPLNAETQQWDALIESLMNVITATPEVQKANADLYNTYFDHDYLVEVRDDTQFRYDTKEFMLRTNMQDVGATGTKAYDNVIQKLVCVDSKLDNPTTFMASTVSTIGGYSTDEVGTCLFPVTETNIYCAFDFKRGELSDDMFVKVPSFSGGGDPGYYPLFKAVGASQTWGKHTMADETFAGNGAAPTELLAVLYEIALSKAVDLYNRGWTIPFIVEVGNATPTWPMDNGEMLDMSVISIDAGTPTPTTISTEHVYAFANLVDIDRKHSLSYKQAEKLVAKDTANLIDKLDVAAVK